MSDINKYITAVRIEYDFLFTEKFPDENIEYPPGFEVSCKAGWTTNSPKDTASSIFEGFLK